MVVRIVRLGTTRASDEGLRIGTVRRPPRGVRKERYAVDDWYDVWLPELAPSEDLVAEARAASSDEDWRRFVRAYRKEMAEPSASRSLDLLARLSRQTNFSVGCYCENVHRCHRSVLADLLREHGGDVRA